MEWFDRARVIVVKFTEIGVSLLALGIILQLLFGSATPLLGADIAANIMGFLKGLGITVPDKTWPVLVRAATFEGMRGSADELVPTAGIFKSNAAFFRRGTSGAAPRRGARRAITSFPWEVAAVSAGTKDPVGG